MSNSQFSVSPKFVIVTTVLDAIKFLFVFIFITTISIGVIVAFINVGKGVDPFGNISSSSMTAVFTALILTVVGTIYKVYWCKSFIFALEDKVITVNGGILNKISKSIYYAKITDVSVAQNIWERIFGYANVITQTAGSPFPEVVFFGVENAMDIKEALLQKMEKKESSN